MLLLQMVRDEGYFDLDVTERARKVLPQFPFFWWMWRRGAIGLVPECREKAIVVGRFCFDLHGATAPLLFFALLLGRQRTRLVAATDTAM